MCYVKANSNEVLFTVQRVYARSMGLHCNLQFIFKLCFARTLHRVRVCMKTIQNRARLFILVLLLFFFFCSHQSVSFGFVAFCRYTTKQLAPHLQTSNVQYEICGSSRKESLFGTYFFFCSCIPFTFKPLKIEKKADHFGVMLSAQLKKESYP